MLMVLLKRLHDGVRHASMHEVADASEEAHCWPHAIVEQVGTTKFDAPPGSD